MFKRVSLGLPLEMPLGSRGCGFLEFRGAGPPKLEKAVRIRGKSGPVVGCGRGGLGSEAPRERCGPRVVVAGGMADDRGGGFA
jgi:hypothetical protein